MATKKKDAVAMEIDQEEAIIIKADANLGTIEDNFDALEVSIAKQVEPYRGLVFTVDTAKEGKKTSTELNKMINELEEKRKAVKRKWNEPLSRFEARVKKVVSLIQEPKAEIDAQLTAFEEQRKEDKKAGIEKEIERQMQSVLGSNQEYIRQCGISFDPRWLNATMSMNQVNEDINEQISRILRDVSTMQSVCSIDEDTTILDDLLIAYQTNRDLSITLRMRTEILAKREAVRKMREEEARRKQELEERQAALSKPIAPEPEPEQEPEYDEDEDEELENENTPDIQGNVETVELETAPAPSAPCLYKVTFQATMSLSQMSELIKTFNDLNIPFKKISHEKIN